MHTDVIVEHCIKVSIKSNHIFKKYLNQPLIKKNAPNIKNLAWMPAKLSPAHNI